jgi:hypothetical protein
VGVQRRGFVNIVTSSSIKAVSFLLPENQVGSFSGQESPGGR